MYTEEFLVCLLKVKDVKAINHIYARYGSLLYGLIRSNLQDSSLSDEVLKKVFVVIINTISSFDSEKSRLYTWMYWIVRIEISKELHNVNADKKRA